MSLGAHLVIFTRWPQFGAGKRRLAAEIGPVDALRFQRVTLANTLRRLSADARWKTWLAVTPDRSGPWPIAAATVSQGDGDLGRRMIRAAKAPPSGPVLIIGSDIPGITREEISRAFSLLGDRDSVFGPAADGGFWAVGFRRRPRFIDPFAGVRWSTPHALSDSLVNLGAASVGFLGVREDVDDAASLARHRGWEFLHPEGGLGNYLSAQRLSGFKGLFAPANSTGLLLGRERS